MDFLDPKKERAHLIRLIAGYVLIAVAILISTLILLYQAYGFGLGKDGEVIQNGLVFVSSQPSGAKLYLDGKLYKSETNTKLQLEEAKYKIEIQRQDYRSWERIITVGGGSVQHFDYPKLFPTKLTTANIKSYADAPGFASQSPDRRWLIVQQASGALNFDVYDLADPKKISAAAEAITLPEQAVSNARSGPHAWKLVEWSTDNRHILVQHTYAAPASGAEASEYILVDRQVAAETVNLTRTLSLGSARQLALRDKKFDLYYVFDPAARTLGTTSQDNAGEITPLLGDVLSYKSYGANMVLYVTDKDVSTAKDKTTGNDVPVSKPVPAGTVLTMLRDNGQAYKIREHSAAGPFLLDMAEYSNDWYVAVGAGVDNKVYVYKNPQRIRKASPTAAMVPVQILKVDAANHISFSSNTEFVMAENGTSFANFDAEYGKGYKYVSRFPLDPPAMHAAWMDGHRLTYISGGKLVVFDYDNINAQTLVPASPNYLPFFDRNYDYVYTLVPGGQSAAAGMTLTATSLLLPEDL